MNEKYKLVFMTLGGETEISFKSYRMAISWGKENCVDSFHIEKENGKTIFFEKNYFEEWRTI